MLGGWNGILIGMLLLGISGGWLQTGTEPKRNEKALEAAYKSDRIQEVEAAVGVETVTVNAAAAGEGTWTGGIPGSEDGTEQSWEWEGNTEEPSAEEIQNTMLQEYDFSELDRILSRNLENGEIHFGDLVTSLMQGDVDGQNIDWKDYLYQIFLQELDANRGIMVKLILLAMITAIFTNLSGSVGKGLMGENGFYITYLIMTALLMSSFTLIYQVAEETVVEILNLMEALIPAYMMAVGLSSGAVSSAVLQEGMVMGITAVSWAVQKIVFPCVQVYVLLGLINNLMEEDRFSKLGELIQTAVGWLMKSVLAFVVGLNAIKSMLAPATDSITTTALQRGLSAIPGGQAVTAVSGVVIGSGVLIKNGIGAGGMLVLLVVVSVPVLKMSVFIFSYKFMAALLQPISDKRMIQGIQCVSEGGQMLITAVLTVLVLFLLSIAIIAVSTNMTYYTG